MSSQLNVKVTQLLLLLLSHFSHVRLCATPSLGFSRQEHWSGLPFPSPMHKSEKWKWSRSVMSDSSRPHGLHPTRLLRPWDFPDKSPGMGCHCLSQCESECVSHLVMSYSLWPDGLQPTRLLRPWDFPGKSTGVGCHFLSRGSSWPRDWTQVSCISGQIFYHLSHQGS